MTVEAVPGGPVLFAPPLPVAPHALGPKVLYAALLSGLSGPAFDQAVQFGLDALYVPAKNSSLFAWPRS